MEQIKLLKNVDPNDYDLFSWNGGQFIAKVSDIHNSNSFSATWIWRNEVIKQKCICIGYTEFIENDILAKDRFTELLTQNEYVIIECFENDEFGRIMTIVFNITNGDKSLNQIMIDEGYGKADCKGKLRLCDYTIDFDVLVSHSI